MEYTKEFLENSKANIIKSLKYTAVIEIGNWHIQLINKTFTQEQIDHMREYFGWEVRNLCE